MRWVLVVRWWCVGRIVRRVHRVMRGSTEFEFAVVFGHGTVPCLASLLADAIANGKDDGTETVESKDEDGDDEANLGVVVGVCVAAVVVSV